MLWGMLWGGSCCCGVVCVMLCAAGMLGCCCAVVLLCCCAVLGVAHRPRPEPALRLVWGASGACGSDVGRGCGRWTTCGWCCTATQGE
eukprot:332967-Rhodomonas_salina.1